MTEEQKQPKSVIHIEFPDPTSIAAEPFQLQGISPFQMFAVARYLYYKGEQMLMGIEMQQQRMIQEQQERNKIVVPKPNIEVGRK